MLGKFIKICKKSSLAYQIVFVHIQSNVQTCQEGVQRELEACQTGYQTHPEGVHLSLNMWVCLLYLSNDKSVYKLCEELHFNFLYLSIWNTNDNH